jgi:fatty acid desaturase
VATRKQVPPPVIDRRLLWLAALLVALSAGLVIGALLPALVIVLVVTLLIVAGALLFIAWDNWRKQYRAWASRPIKAKQVKREVQG